MRKKITYQFISLFFLASLSFNLNAQNSTDPDEEVKEASAYWELSANDSFVSEGPITVIPQVLNNMDFDRYAKPNSNTTWEDGLVDDETRTQRLGVEPEWPDDNDVVADRYIQFGVTANEGSLFTIDSIGMYVGAASTKNMAYRILASKTEDFSDPILIGERLENETNMMYPISYKGSIELEEKENLYLRVYPWLRGGGSRAICLHGVLIKGTVVGGTTDPGTGFSEITGDNNSLSCIPTIVNESTTLTYTTFSQSPVTIEVRSITGEKIMSIQENNSESGVTYQKELNLSTCVSGVYICSVTSGNKTEYVRIIKK